MSFLGSFVLLVNNLTGPGMVVLPFLFVHAGWAVPTLILVLVAALSSLSGLCLAEAISSIPGNADFSLRIEWTNLYGYYFGATAARASQMLVVVCLTALNSASIDAVGQVADAFLTQLLGHSWAFQLRSSQLGPSWSIVSDGSGFNGVHGPVLSAGYLYSMAMIIPLSCCHLETSLMQRVFFLGSLAAIGVSCWHFAFDNAAFNAVSTANESSLSLRELIAAFPATVGILFFNYAATVTVPTWLSEKAPEVSVTRAVLGANAWATLLYLVVGFLGASAWQGSHPAGKGEVPVNMLTHLATVGGQSPARVAVRYAALLWAFCMMASGIPVYATVVRYNLLSSGVAGPRWAFVWATVLPWAVSWLWMAQAELGVVVTWTALSCFGLVNFIGPLCLYLASTYSGPRGSQCRDSPYLDALSGVQERQEEDYTRRMRRIAGDSADSPCQLETEDETEALLSGLRPLPAAYTGSFRGSTPAGSIKPLPSGPAPERERGPPEKEDYGSLPLPPGASPTYDGLFFDRILPVQAASPPQTALSPSSPRGLEVPLTPFSPLPGSSDSPDYDRDGKPFTALPGWLPCPGQVVGIAVLMTLALNIAAIVQVYTGPPEAVAGAVDVPHFLQIDIETRLAIRQFGGTGTAAKV